jgi:hypothetical protein
MCIPFGSGGAGRSLATKEQYQTFGQMYANTLGCNLTYVRTAGSRRSSSCYQAHLQNYFLDYLLQVTDRVERLHSLNASDVHHITRPIPPIHIRQGNPRRPSRLSRNWVKGLISSWLEYVLLALFISSLGLTSGKTDTMERTLFALGQF